MASVQGNTEQTRTPGNGALDMKLEAVVIPVSDVDRAKAFYTGLGWRLDADFVVGDNFRGVQVTPPGSPSSVHFGQGLTTAAPGSGQGFLLVVADIDAARAELASHGVQVSGVFHREGNNGQVPGPNPTQRSYFTYATFTDPDGNRWLLQEVTERLPGRVTAQPSYASPNDLAGALRRAEAAHGKHEAKTGQRDANWPAWYAEYMVREQSGEALPS